jgi:hypothetical protein
MSKLHKVTINDIPVKHKFKYEGDDLHLPHKGGFIGSLLTSLIPVGIDLVSRIFNKGSGIDNINHSTILKGKPLLLKVHDGKSIIAEHEISPEAGAILFDKKLIHQLHKNKHHLENVGQGLYGASGVYGEGVYGAKGVHAVGGTQLSINASKGGRIGNLKNIN